MPVGLSTIIIGLILILLALSFYFHRGHYKNINMLFNHKGKMWKEIEELKKNIRKHD